MVVERGGQRSGREEGGGGGRGGRWRREDGTVAQTGSGGTFVDDSQGLLIGVACKLLFGL